MLKEQHAARENHDEVLWTVMYDNSSIHIIILYKISS